MLLSKTRIAILFILLTVLCFTKAYGQEIYPQDADRYYAHLPGEHTIGRWDVTFYTKMELNLLGYKLLGIHRSCMAGF